MSDAFHFGRMVKEADDSTGGLFGRAGYFDTMKDMYWDRGLAQIPAAAKRTYEWGKTPIGALQHAKANGLTNLPYAEQEKAWRESLPPPGPGLADKINDTASDLWTNFKHYGYNNPVWRATRGAGRFLDAAFDGNNSDRPLRAGWRAMMGPRDPNSFISRTGRAINDVYNTIGDVRKMTGQALDSTKQVSATPEELAAASAASKPTMGSYLSDSMKSNPLWLLPAAGLGGLGAYGLYKLLSSRRDAKKRRRLMSPAAIIN